MNMHEPLEITAAIPGIQNAYYTWGTTNGTKTDTMDIIKMGTPLNS
jgi:hypothetical protein